MITNICHDPRDLHTHVHQILRNSTPDSGPVNTSSGPNVVSMLGQRRRRWANIETTFGGLLVFAGGGGQVLYPQHVSPMLSQCLANVSDVVLIVKQRRTVRSCFAGGGTLGESRTCLLDSGRSVMKLNLGHEHLFPQRDTRRRINVGLPLVQRRRRWANVNSTLIQCLVSVLP